MSEEDDPKERARQKRREAYQKAKQRRKAYRDKKKAELEASGWAEERRRRAREHRREAYRRAKEKRDGASSHSPQKESPPSNPGKGAPDSTDDTPSSSGQETPSWLDENGRPKLYLIKS